MDLKVQEEQESQEEQEVQEEQGGREKQEEHFLGCFQDWVLQMGETGS